MKLWIKTKIVGKGTEDDPRRPYLSVNLPYSMIDLGNECLARVSSKPEEIKKLLGDQNITVLKDEEARAIIKSRYPNANLENVDVIDIEIDEIAKENGLDPHEIRRDIQIPTVGKQVLQDQEKHLMTVVSKKLGFSRAYWDKVAGIHYNKKGIEIDRDIRTGYNYAHTFVLDRIRARHIALKRMKELGIERKRIAPIFQRE